MERSPPLLEQAPVGHRLGQRVLERVLDVGEEVRLVEELAGLKPRQPLLQVSLGETAHRAQQRQGQIAPDHGGALQEPLVLERQVVDPRREDRLHRGRHLDVGDRLGQPASAPRPDQHLLLDQRANALLEEERVALRAVDQELLERAARSGPSPSSTRRSCSAFSAGSGVEPQLGVVRLVAPRVPVLGPVVDEQQDARGGQALDQAVQERLRLGIDPVQVLEDEEERLRLALADEQELDAVEDALEPVGRVERLPLRVGAGKVEQRPERGEDRGERRVERVEGVGDLLLDPRRRVPLVDLEEAHRRGRGSARAR